MIHFHRTHRDPLKSIRLTWMGTHNDGVITSPEETYQHPSGKSHDEVKISGKSQLISNRYYMFCMFNGHADINVIKEYGDDCYIVNTHMLITYITLILKRSPLLVDVIYTDTPPMVKPVLMENAEIGGWSVNTEEAPVYKPSKYSGEAETRLLIPMFPNEGNNKFLKDRIHLSKCFKKVT